LRVAGGGRRVKGGFRKKRFGREHKYQLACEEQRTLFAREMCLRWTRVDRLAGGLEHGYKSTTIGIGEWEKPLRKTRVEKGGKNKVTISLLRGGGREKKSILRFVGVEPLKKPLRNPLGYE